MSSEQADEAPVTEVVLDVEGTRWSFDAGFLRSGWTCIWGQGCLGIEDEADTERQLGCCSVGAELIDDDEARLIGALGSTLDPALFEQAPLAAEIGVLNETGRHTWVVADRCIFHNSVDFEGGAGCALHLSALAEGDEPIDWKPSVCWQLPIKVERSVSQQGEPVARLRPWRRTDWGPGGETMAWCCSDPTEAPEAFTGDEPAFRGLAPELAALLGDDGYDALARALS
ncbi:MAG: hypothetical protein P8N02_04625 [Actinomycetota bacterium]|nr:hypothetical protein [Actinomycetota bacterium]